MLLTAQPASLTAVVFPAGSEALDIEHARLPARFGSCALSRNAAQRVRTTARNTTLSLVATSAIDAGARATLVIAALFVECARSAVGENTLAPMPLAKSTALAVWRERLTDIRNQDIDSELAGGAGFSGRSA